ncbi:hypothetical protein J4450_07955 [Candidatus Micrarchaeota archaeon]|nr:hypothetical protein [Candidatus Micrarchaeota archaeon]
MADPNPIAAGLFLLIGLVIFYLGFRQWRTYNQIKNTATSKVRSVAAGFCEIAGKIVAGQKILTTPFTKKQCVYYKYRIDEEVERVRTRNGKTEIDRDWETRFSGTESTPFYVEDDTGKIEVDPVTNAPEIYVKLNYEKQTNNWTNPPEVNEFLGERAKILRRPKRRFLESSLEIGENFYVLGTAFPKEGVVSEKREEMLVIKKGLNKLFIVSDSSENALVGGMKWSIGGMLLIGAGLIIVGVVFLLGLVGV